MNIRKLFVLVTAATLPIAIQGCGLQDRSRRSKATESYQNRDPLAEARLNFSKGDFRIYSAMGHALYYPGLDSHEGARLAERHGVQPVPDTTDAIGGRIHGAYIEAAVGHAGAYNLEMARLLASSGE